MEFSRRNLFVALLVALSALDVRAAVPSNGGYIVQSDPGTVAGLLVGLTLLSILGIGLCCLGEIQTPTRIATRYPPSKKEF